MPRVLTRVGGNKLKLKLAVVFLLTYIGTPCVFYGDEIGLKTARTGSCSTSTSCSPGCASPARRCGAAAFAS